MDGRSFTYQGQTVFPRKAVQRVAFSPKYPTNISLPIFQPGWTNVDFTQVELKQNDFLMFPNPANESVSIITGSREKSTLRVFDLVGKEIYSDVFLDEIKLNNRHFVKGVYIVQVTTDNVSQSKRLIINSY